MKKNKIKISLIINTLIIIFTIVASIVMFTGFKFMKGAEPVLEMTKLSMFRFFTVDSNIFMAIMALVFSIEEIKLLKKKIKEIPLSIYILKLMATTGVSLTFLVVFAYLGPFSSGGIPSMIRNSNLFFHLLTPVLSIITFVMFEKTNKIKFKQVFYGLLPTGLYSIYYMANILIHTENGKVSPLYDWYWFMQKGLWTAVIVIPLFLLLTFGISFALWKTNKAGIKK